MKNKILKIIPIIFMLLGILSVNIYAVTYTSTDCTVKSEENITITVKASENLQNYDLTLTSYTGLTYVSCSANENAAVNSSTGAISYATLGSGTTTLGTYKFKAPKVTEDTTYNVVFDINGTSNTAKVLVKAEVQTPETPATTQNPTTSTPNPTTPAVTEPKFTDVNKTMYATGEINLRASWSTSSEKTTIAKGTELKVTGTSTEKVNGYVWYRVSYNGATKYVASYLLTNTKPEEEKKSDNAYLKTLTIENQELIPVFNKETTSYTMQIANDITELNIKAEAEDEKASVSIQGNKDLKDGENKVIVSVSAEDGTIKIYEITATRAEKTALGLKSLTIKDIDIESMFKTDIYEYEIYIKDVAKLEIEAIANEETATIEILGNEDLQEGENTITIIVSSQDGNEKVTYQIKANKIINNVDTNTKQGLDPKIYLYIGIGVLLLIALIIVVIYTIKHRNEEEFEYSDNFEGFPGELPERQEKEEYEEENEEENEQNMEQTQEINYNFRNDKELEKDKEVEENEEIEKDEEDKLEEQNTEDRKAKIDYFLDNEEEDEKTRRKRGKHF